MERVGDFAVTYVCTNPKCGNQQTVRFFSREDHQPVLCCTKCRAGFNVDLARQLEHKIGMFPVAKQVVEEVPEGSLAEMAS